MGPRSDTADSLQSLPRPAETKSATSLHGDSHKAEAPKHRANKKRRRKAGKRATASDERKSSTGPTYLLPPHRDEAQVELDVRRSFIDLGDSKWDAYELRWLSVTDRSYPPQLLNGDCVASNSRMSFAALCDDIGI